MNELESILNYLETTSLEPHDDYTSEFTYKEQKLLWNYIKKLKDKIYFANVYIEKHKRKDGFLNLNEWQTKDLKNILEKGKIK